MIIKPNLIVNGHLAVDYYIPVHFNISELVTKELCETVDEYKLWYLFDSRILWTIDKIRELYNSIITVNNWKSGGTFTLRGYRPPESNISPNIKVDQHKLGRAIDFNIENMKPSEFIKDVQTYPKQFEFQFITGLELSTTWNHIDCRNFDKAKNNNQPLTFNP